MQYSDSWCSVFSRTTRILNTSVNFGAVVRAPLRIEEQCRTVVCLLELLLTEHVSVSDTYVN